MSALVGGPWVEAELARGWSWSSEAGGPSWPSGRRGREAGRAPHILTERLGNQLLFLSTLSEMGHFSLFL